MARASSWWLGAVYFLILTSSVMANTFSPWTPERSLNATKRSLALSYASYCPPDVIKAWDCKFCEEEFPEGLSHIEVIQNSTHFRQAFVGVSSSPEEGIIVSFRGTMMTSFKNWVSDLNALHHRSPFLGCEVHAGFLAAYTSMSEDIMGKIYELRDLYPAHNITITGHSLGGSMANLCAVDLVTRLNADAVPNASDIVRLVTFGAPRVGNNCYAHTVSTLVPNHMRMAKANDPVPRLAPTWMGYRHSALEIFETTTKNNTEHYKECDGSGEDPKCSNNFTPYSFSAHLHYMGIYEDCVVNTFAPTMGLSPGELKKNLETFSSFHVSSSGEEE